MVTLNEALTVKVKGDASHYNSTLKGLGKTAAKNVKQIKDEFIQLGKTVAKVGIAGGAAFVGMGAYAVNEAAKVEKAFAKFSTLYDKPISDLSAFKDKMKDVSNTYGIDLTETMEAFYQAASGGYTSLEDSNALVSAAAKAAVAGEVELKVAVEALVRMLSAYNLSGEKASQVSDLLFKTVGLGIIEFKQMAPLLGTVASGAANAKISMEEFSGTVATLSKGLNAPMTFTAFSAMIRAFKNPTEEMKKQGLDIFKVMEDGWTETVTHVANLPMKDFIALKFPEEAAKGFDIIRKDGAKLLNENVKAMEKAEGATMDAFNKMSTTFSHQVKTLSVQLKNIAIEFGEALGPAIGNIAKYLEASMPAIQAWAGKVGNVLNSLTRMNSKDWEVWSLTLKTMWTDFKNWGYNALASSMEWLDGAAANFFEGLEGILGTIWSAIKAGAGKALEAGKKLMGWIWDGMKAKWKEILNWLPKVFDEIYDKLGDPNYHGDLTKHYWGYDGSGNNKSRGGWIEAEAGRWIGGNPGPDMVPTMTTQGEAVISAPVAEANRDLVDGLVRAGSRGGTYHDVSTNIFNFGDKITRSLIRDRVIPEFVQAKKAALGRPAW